MGYAPDKWDTHFNSIKVQLKLCPPWFLNSRELVFQFHKGTIKTSKSLQRFLSFLTNFNSIKVQLKQREIITFEEDCSISIP